MDDRGESRIIEPHGFEVKRLGTEVVHGGGGSVEENGVLIRGGSREMTHMSILEEKFPLRV